MGDNDNGVFEVDQKILKPCDRIQIQMVGRLVEKQNVRIAEQCLRKQNLNLNITVQISHHRVVIFRSDAQTV